jgi:hypothetical protein
VYQDNDIEALRMTETITRQICEMIKFLREEFKALQFDFHSCFYYEEMAVTNPET